MDKKKYVGQGIVKKDAKALLSGKPVYTDDLVMDNALVVKLKRSIHAFAKIKSIDTSKAMEVDGVEIIITYKDVPNNRFTLAGQTFPEPSPYDRLILDEYVRFVGDPVAIVAGRDEKCCLEAIKLIKDKQTKEILAERIKNDNSFFSFRQRNSTNTMGITNISGARRVLTNSCSTDCFVLSFQSKGLKIDTTSATRANTAATI